MRTRVLISRPASGTGSVVTVTVTEDDITAKYAYRTVGMDVQEGIVYAKKQAVELLRQAKEIM